jgi:hypothetical protein
MLGADKSFTALLNHPLALPTSNGDKAESSIKELTRLFGALLDVAGVAAGELVTPERAGELEGECVALRYGEADIITLLANPIADSKGIKATIDPGGDWWAYDMRAGKPLGKGKKLEIKTPSGDARLICLLPYAVEKLYLADVGDVTAGRRLPIRITVETNGATPGTHLVHVSLRRGLGAPIPWSSQNVTCEHGKGEAYIPLALDEEPGVYTLTARDVLSGATAQTTVVVNGRTPSVKKTDFGPNGRRMQKQASPKKEGGKKRGEKLKS